MKNPVKNVYKFRNSSRCKEISINLDLRCSNGDIFEKNHDEINFEFLGNIRGKNWRIQTNIYGNGSTNVGREERYDLWFDPSEDFHQYSILWTENQIVFYVDNVPIREIKRSQAIGGDFPSKQMSLYATLWDGFDWATNGGRYRVNYKYAPYIADFLDFVLHGCVVNPLDQSKCEAALTSDSILSGIIGIAIDIFPKRVIQIRDSQSTVQDVILINERYGANEGKVCKVAYRGGCVRWGKGISSALALSNAITNLAVFTDLLLEVLVAMAVGAQEVQGVDTNEKNH